MCFFYEYEKRQTKPQKKMRRVEFVKFELMSSYPPCLVDFYTTLLCYWEWTV